MHQIKEDLAVGFGDDGVHSRGSGHSVAANLATFGRCSATGGSTVNYPSDHLPPTSFIK
jgi:hypothetical protein